MNLRHSSTPLHLLTASILVVLLSGCQSLFAQGVPAASSRPQPQPVVSEPAPHVSAVEDWTSHSVVFSDPAVLEKSGQPGAAERANKIRNDPRYVMQQLRRRQPVEDSGIAALASLEAKIAATSRGSEASTAANGLVNGEAAADISRIHTKATPSHAMQRDWSMSLGLAGVATDMYPSKYAYNAQSNPDCQRDFVVFGPDVDGSVDQATIIGFNNLYVNAAGTGYCAGTSPKVLFSYYVNTGAMQTSPSISLDGTRLIFVDSIAGGSQLHVVKIGTTGNNGTSASAPVYPGNGNNAVDSSVVLSGNTQVSRSSVFMDWVNDNAYVGDDNGVLHLFHPVLSGPLAEVMTGGWPITILSGTAAPPVLSAPSFDNYTQNVFVGDAYTGHLFYVRTAATSPGFCYSGGAPPCLGGYTSGSNTLAGLPVGTGTMGHPYGALYDPPLIDVVTSKVVVGTGNGDPTYCNVQEMVLQIDEAFATTPIYYCMGLGNLQNTHLGAFDNAYYSSPVSGKLYWAAHDVTTTDSAIWYFGFDASGNMQVPATEDTNLLVATVGHPPSPLTEIYDTFTGTDWLSLGVPDGSCGGNPNGGCVMAFNITPGASPVNYGPWLPAQNYPLNYQVIDTNGHIQEVTTAGTSGVVTPGWVVTGNTLDGTSAYATATGTFNTNTATAGEYAEINGTQLFAATPTRATAIATLTGAPDASAVTITDGANVLSLSTNATVATATGTFAAVPTSATAPTITITNSAGATSNTLTMTTNAVAASQTGTLTGSPAAGQTATVGGLDVVTASAEASASGTATFTSAIAVGKTVTITNGSNVLVLTNETATAASATVTLNAVPAVGDTVTLAGTMYTFNASVAACGATANCVVIAGNKNNTAANLEAAVNDNTAFCGSAVPCFSMVGAANVTVVAGTPAAGAVVISDRTTGLSGNSVAVSTPSGNISIAGAITCTGPACSTTLTGGLGGNLCASSTTGQFDATLTAAGDAGNLAATINSCYASYPVTGVSSSLGGAVVTITAKTPGSGGNSIVLATNAGGITLAGAACAGGTCLTGGNDVSNVPPMFAITNAAGIALSTQQIAANLAAAIAADTMGVGVTASSTGLVVTVTATALGTAGDTITLAETLSNFTWAAAHLMGGSLGSDNCTNSTTGTYSIGAAASANSAANQLAAAINACNTAFPAVGVTAASLVNKTVTITSVTPGPYLAVGASNNTGIFTWSAVSGGSAGTNTCTSSTTGTFKTSNATATLASNLKTAINKCPATVGVDAVLGTGSNSCGGTTMTTSQVCIEALALGSSGNSIALAPATPPYLTWSGSTLTGGSDGVTTATGVTPATFQIWSGAAELNAGTIATNFAQLITNNSTLWGVNATYTAGTGCTAGCAVTVKANNYGIQYDYPITKNLTGFVWAPTTAMAGGLSPVVWTEQSVGNGETTVVQATGSSGIIADTVFFPPWQSSTWALGARIVDSYGYVEKVTTAGTSGATTPGWCTSTGSASPGCTTPDGSVVWTNQGASPTSNLYLGSLNGTLGDKAVKYTQKGLQ